MIRLISPVKFGRVLSALIRNRMARESLFPFYASFKLTSRCHFSCAFCNIKDESRPDLPADRVFRILDNLSRSSVVLVSFEGGEPLLRNDIGRLLEYARSKDFYLLFTTSERHPERYPLKEYGRYIDFLHVSIDEGHRNLELYDRLEDFMGLGPQLSVQVVVTADTLPALEEKVRRCHGAGANTVVMPAVHMNRTQDRFPDLARLQDEIGRLKALYPDTIWTPDGYFEAVREGRCSTASVIIDSDGTLFYPCHILETRGPDLSRTDLMEFLRGGEASAARRSMKGCGRQCGWYQYFSINDFVSAGSAWKALRPALSKGLGKA